MSDAKSPQVPAAYRRDEVRFARLIHSNGVVADAFRSLSANGCDPQRLKFDVFRLSRYPQRKPEKFYNAKDFLRLKAIATKVRKAADELKPLQDLLFEESFSSLNLRRKFLD